MARPVQPELILEGPIRLEYLLDVQGRYVLVSAENADEAPRRAYSIVDWKKATRCDLPSEVVRYIPPIFGPTDQRRQSPLLVLPVVIQDGDAQVLKFFDEHCQLHGETDFGSVSSATQTVPLDEDGREVILYGNGMGVVAIADPWKDEHTEIASGVRRFAFVQRTSMYTEPQMLWLVEDGLLTQRTLDGSLLLTLGKAVTEFTQLLFGELRIAFVDGGDLYEAIAPEFIPTRLAESACSPSYRGSTLELLRPCSERQLVRINLQTGEPTEFEKGVYESYTDSGHLFEMSRDAMGVTHQWVEPPGGERTEIKQPFAGRPLVLSEGRLAGLKDLPIDADHPGGRRSRTFVIQDLALGLEASVLEGIAELFIFNDNRTSSFVWMVQHDLHVTPNEEEQVAEGEEPMMPAPDCGDGDIDPGEQCDDRNHDPNDGCSALCSLEHRIGDLSLFSERSLDLEKIAEGQTPALETIRTGVPERAPLGGAPTGVHGYSIETAIPFREPLVVVISDAKPLAKNRRLSRGKLEARLLSGELGSTIADDVTSYFLVTTPLPGVLYGVEEGGKPGLWFAAL